MSPFCYHPPELVKGAPRLLFLEWGMQEYGWPFAREYLPELRQEPGLIESTESRISPEILEQSSSNLAPEKYITNETKT